MALSQGEHNAVMRAEELGWISPEVYSAALQEVERKDAAMLRSAKRCGDAEAEVVSLRKENANLRKLAGVRERRLGDAKFIEDNDINSHDHQSSAGCRSLKHIHAWGSTPHTHMLRQVCDRPECVGCRTHDIHPSPKES